MVSEAAATRLVVVLWSCGPERDDGAVRVAAPLVYALAARALDLEVEMHFTSTTVRWLVPGVAGAAFTDRKRTRTVLQYLNEAKDAGVRLFACAMARAEHAADESLLDACAGIAGAATVVAASLRGDARTLVF
jgi:predicted peroxiredoxin